MKEFAEKLIERLEEKTFTQMVKVQIRDIGYPPAYINEPCEVVTLDDVKAITIELSEEYYANTPQKSAGGWIPVTERLPGNNQSVIFTDTDGEVEAGIYDANKNWCVNDAYYPNAFNFVAWQPLPEAYISEKYENAEWRDSVMKHFTNVE